MDKQILHFTVNEQALTVDEPIKISTNKVNYIQAHFDLGENWDGFDSVRAIWFNDFQTISTVLDSLGNCVVPFEVMKRKGCVKVNLVGSISDDDVLTDRLTSYPAVAVIVDCTAQITGANTQPITPSEFEQFAQRVHTDAERAEAGATASEQSAQNASDSATSAHNSAESAHDDKIAIEEAIAEVIQQIEDFEQVQVVVNTLPPSSQATSDFTDGVLTLGIPQGVKGDTGNGIQSITKTGTSGLVDTYTITFTDGQTTTFTVTNGAKGDTGNGIQSIAKTSTVGLVDTYTITYTDGTTTTFTVTNGEKGDKGDTGEVSQAELDEAVTDLKSALKRSDDDFQTFSFAREYAVTFDNGAYKWYPLAVPNGTKLILRTTDGSSYTNGGLLLYDTYAGTQLGAINPTVNGSEAAFVIDRDNVGYIRTGADFTHGSAYVYIGTSGFDAKDRIVDLESLYKAINNYKYQINIAFGQLNSAGEFVPNSVRRMSTVDILHFDFDLLIPAALNTVMTHIVKYSDASGSNPQTNIGTINRDTDYVVYAGEYFRLSFYIDGDSTGDYTGHGLNNYIYNSIALFNRKQIEDYTKVGQLQNLYLINNNVRSVAHRGMSRVAPENTLPAFIEARRAGFEWVETDVSWTHDGVPVLLHDITIDRTSDGTGNIADLDYDDIKDLDFGSWFSSAYAGTKIPRFDEFLTLCRKIGLKARLDIRAHASEQLEDACKMVVRYGMIDNVEFTGGEADVINSVIPHTRIIVNASTVDAQAIANAIAIRNAGNEVNITTQTINSTVVGLCADALIPLEYWTAGTDAAILNLDPYVTVITTEGLIAGDVLYRSVIS